VYWRILLVKCDTCALFVFKVHMEKIHTLFDTISWQMANFEKICKICCGKSQGFWSPEDFLEKNPSCCSDCDRPRTFFRLRTGPDSTFSLLQINVIRHRAHHMHSWLYTILTRRNGYFYTNDNLIN